MEDEEVPAPAPFPRDKPTVKAAAAFAAVEATESKLAGYRAGPRAVWMAIANLKGHPLNRPLIPAYAIALGQSIRDRPLPKLNKLQLIISLKDDRADVEMVKEAWTQLAAANPESFDESAHLLNGPDGSWVTDNFEVSHR